MLENALCVAYVFQKLRLGTDWTTHHVSCVVSREF